MPDLYFGLDPATADTLMRDTADMLQRVVSEIRHELDHIEDMMRGSADALQNRKPSRELVQGLRSAQDAIQGAGTALSREMRDIEDVVGTLHNIVMRLDASW